MVGFFVLYKKVMKKGRTFGVDCVIHENGDTYWDDGCYRIYHDNGREKEAKVMFHDKTMWNFTFRDETGKIIEEYNERVDGKPDVDNRIIELEGNFSHKIIKDL